MITRYANIFFVGKQRYHNSTTTQGKIKVKKRSLKSIYAEVSQLLGMIRNSSEAKKLLIINDEMLNDLIDQINLLYREA